MQRNPIESRESRESVARALLLRGDDQFANHEYVQAEQSYRTALQSLSATAEFSIDRAIMMKSISISCRMQDKTMNALQLNRQADALMVDKRRALENLFLASTCSREDDDQESAQTRSVCLIGFLPGFLIGVLILSLVNLKLLLM